MPSSVITLIIVAGSMFALFIIISTVGNYYSLNRIKNKTVGQGQHGTARWATKKEIKKTYKQIDFKPDEWRTNPNSRPTEQGIVVGCKNSKNGTTAMVDTGDVHALMIGAAGVGKTAYWFIPALNLPVHRVCHFYQPTLRAILFATMEQSQKSITATEFLLLTCVIPHAHTATISCIL